jgi:hypothetical protein
MKSEQELPRFLERIQKCKHCEREINRSSMSFLENPYCNECLAERVGSNLVFPGEVRWRMAGHYMEHIEPAQQRPS